MFIGKNINLRSIEQEDLEILRNWRNNPMLRSYFREYREISKTNQITWYEQVVNPQKSALMFAIEDKKHNLIGACGLCYLDWLRKSADFSIYIGWNNLYLDDILAIESAEILIEYGFHELGLHRLWAEVYAHDNKKQDFFDKLGFSRDGILRESHWTQGRWIDSIYYSLLSTDNRKE